MTTRRNTLPRFLFIFVALLFEDVAADIDGGVIDVNEFDGFDESPDYLDDSLSNFDNKPLRPVENHEWQSPNNLGQISGVAVDPLGNPIVFHRGDRVWGDNTFTEDNVYQEEYKGPISVNTVLVLNPSTGKVVRGWGNRTFYLPHGIHVDTLGNVWLTDVALHQVFKYHNSGVPRLTLGQRFEPGSDLKHFCQPTAVAVAATGEIVVADGYCNHRIVLFDSNAKPKYSIGEQWISLNIPHSLTILSTKEVCVADRENERVICLNVGLPGSKEKPDPPYSIRHRLLSRVFAIASYRDIIYAVNGMISHIVRPMGFTIHPTSQSVIDFWGPDTDYFYAPHGIAIGPNGTALYVAEIGPNRVWKFDLV